MTSYYTSQIATNGYAVGNDSNNGLSKTTPFFTLARGIAFTSPFNGDLWINDGVYLTTDGTQGNTHANIYRGTYTAENAGEVIVRGTHGSYVALLTPPADGLTLALSGIVFDGRGETLYGVTLSNTNYHPDVLIDGVEIINTTDGGFSANESTYNLTIRNLNLESTIQANYWGVKDFVHTSGYVDIDGLTFNLTDSAATLKTIKAVYVQSSDGGTDTTASIKNVIGAINLNVSAGVGVEVSDIPNAIVDGCDITINGPDGALIDQKGVWIRSSGFQADGCIISGCNVIIGPDTSNAVAIGDTTAPPGSYANKCNNAKLINNRCYREPGRATLTPHGVALYKCSGGEAYGNLAVNFSPNLYPEMNDATTIWHHNVAIDGYGGHSVYVKGSTGTKLYNQTLVSSVYGIAMAEKKTPDNTQSTDIVWRNHISVQTCANPRHVMVDVLCTGTFDYNIYWQTTEIAANTWMYQGVEYESFAEWQAAGFDTHSICADPLFVDIDNQDYRILPGSPAIGTGLDVGLVADYNGNQLYKPYNIGALGGNPDLMRRAPLRVS